MERKNVVTSGFSGPLKGETAVPPDKSMSHRSLIIGSLTKGKIKISNFLESADCLCTLEILKAMGCEIEFLDENTLFLDAKNAYKEPKTELYCGNSGTTMRLLTGLLSAQNFKTVLTGDISLSKRPMKRVIEPLTRMGAVIKSNEGKAPLVIEPSNLHGEEYLSPIASAQVKSALLLAGTQISNGKTTVLEHHLSRNHTEKMLQFFGSDIETFEHDGLFGATVSQTPLIPRDLVVMNDISSAAFPMVAACIVKGSQITLTDIGLNETRSGIIDVLKAMNADIEVISKGKTSNEEIGDIKIKYSPDLKGTKIEGSLIPRLIDEIPAIALLATQAEGVTVIKNAGDLKNKESDRIAVVERELRKFGAKIEGTEDGFIIEGKNAQKGLFEGDVEVECDHDHRIAMTGYVASLISKKPCCINGFEWVKTSFPNFLELFNKLEEL